MSEQGSALPVIAVIIAGIGLAIVAINHLSGESVETRAELNARPSLERVADQIALFAQVKGRLPRPADGADGSGEEVSYPVVLDTENWVVPWKTLGLEHAYDPWQNQISYRTIGGNFGDAPTKWEEGKVSICQEVDPDDLQACASVKEEQATFVIFSHGPDGRGAFDAQGNQNPLPGHKKAKANIEEDPSPTQLYFQMPRTPVTVTGDDAFGQIMVYRVLEDLSPPDPDDCVPGVFGHGFATTGEDGVLLKGSPNLENLPSDVLMTEKLQRPNWGHYPTFSSSGTSAERIPVPEAPPNTSDEDDDYVAGQWPDVDRALTASHDFNSVALKSNGSLSLDPVSGPPVDDSPIVINTREDFELQQGHLYVNRDTTIYAEEMSVGGSSTIEVANGITLKIIISDDFEISGSSSIKTAGPAANIVILVDGEVELKGSSEITGYIYASEELEMGGNTKITGAVVADHIYMHGSATFTYEDTGAGGPSLCP